jgi:hypothetical protein
MPIPGVRRAGQGRGAAKRTLDAPKRSGKIGNRSDGRPGRHRFGKVGVNTCGRPAIDARQDRCRFSGVNAHSVSCDSHAQNSRAPAHLRHRHRGVSDPAGRPRGRRCGPPAGSLTPHPCCFTALGRSMGGTMRRPFLTATSATTSRPFNKFGRESPATAQRRALTRPCE